MGPADESSRFSTARPRELAGVALFFVALVGAQFAVTGAFSLFTRHFWLDEMYSQRLAADPDVAHLLAALRGGAETHPPTYYVLARGFTRLAGDDGETGLRAFALLAALAALVGTYAVLRMTFPPLVALAAVLALWAHPLMQRYAFEARAYGPWLAAAVWFAYWLGLALRPGQSRLVLLPLAGTAVVLCTLHYFGIITLACVFVADLAWARSSGARRLPVVAAVAAGPAALLACVPLLLGQRAALTVPTWVKTAEAVDVGPFLLSVLLPRFLMVVPAMAFVAWLLRGRRPAGARGDPTAVIGLAALGLFPLLLITFSWTVQSVLVDRYALPATAAIAAAVAVVVAGLSRPWLLALCALLVASGTRHLYDLAQEYQARDRDSDALIAAVRRDTGEGLVVFEQPHHLHVVCRYGPDLASHCFLLDFEPGDFATVPRSRVFNRDLARRFAAFYGMPGLVSWDRIKSAPQWYLVSEGQGFGRGSSVDPNHWYPGFAPHRLDERLYVLRKTAGD
jgi:hypothetical protein